jgi:UDP-N-acetylglucosamine acyltransferase
MTAKIHPTAIVDKKAELASDVVIGPWAMVGPKCTIGGGSVLQARATLEENVTLGERVTIGTGSILGGRPQDLKFKGEETWCEIGDDTTIREYVTINRGTSQSFRTTVGVHGFLMSYTHLGHDCHVGDHVIISNNGTLAGHVTIGDYAILSGFVAVHQFAKIGRHAFIGGMSRVNKDVPPFVKAVGNPLKLYGLNSVGLQRRGFEPDVLAELKKGYRLFFNSTLNVSQAIAQAQAELKPFEEVTELISFVEESGRGVTV